MHDHVLSGIILTGETNCWHIMHLFFYSLGYPWPSISLSHILLLLECTFVKLQVCDNKICCRSRSHTQIKMLVSSTIKRYPLKSDLNFLEHFFNSCHRLSSASCTNAEDCMRYGPEKVNCITILYQQNGKLRMYNQID